MSFPPKSIKTKVVVSRYPRKISLLKDLLKGYPPTTPALNA